MSDNLKNFARAIKCLTWVEMNQVADSLASEIPHLIKADKMDPHGMAISLDGLADGIVEALAKEIEGESSHE